MPADEFAQASQECQLVNAVCDSSGFCQFLQPNLDDIREYYTLLYGEEVTREQIADQGWQCLQDEWEFNRRAGYTEKDDELPDCMKEDAIGPAKAVFDVPREVIVQTYQRFEPNEELFTAKATG
jgi:aldehyde:ferredoxin oxidoreductase